MIKKVLNEYQLKRLKEHKYSSEGNTFLDPYMQPFWRWLVEQIPLTWAPNAITLWGLIGNILSTIFLMIYCPNGHGEAPWWCYLLCAIFLFIYQSLDAIDGKQARRTNSSTPLGELFDHGCDAMSMAVIILGVGISIQLGTSPYLFSIFVFLGVILFYMAQWKTATIGKMQFQQLDVTEGQFMVMSLYIFNSCFGGSVWKYEVITGLRLNAILCVISSLTAVYISIASFQVICRTKENVEKNNKQTIHNQSPLIPSRFLPAISIIIYVLLGVACSIFSKSDIMESNIVLYHIVFGIVGTKLCCVVLVSYMTKTEMPCIDSIFLGPLLLIIIQLLAIDWETSFLWIAFVMCLADIFIYATRVCKEICDHLNIFCFKISPP